jgi:glucan 1,3-beta-glucosidase
VIPAGIYIIGSTLSIPVNSVIVGESYPVILAARTAFSSANSPSVAVRVGTAGDRGNLEISGVVFSAAGGSGGKSHAIIVIII